MPQINLPVSTTRRQYVVLQGGLDLLTPPLELKPGVLRDALNYEQSINGGYSRIGPYERMDGRAAPSTATYFTLTLSAMTGSIVPGNTIVGATSGATGSVIDVDTTSGSPVVAYTGATGAFTDGETIKVSGSPVGVDLMAGGSGTSSDYDARMTFLASNVLRALIGVVPGSGMVRGGFFYQGTNYAFRDNAGGTALALYASSAGGWTLVPYGFEISFTGGTTEYAAGSTLTQGSVSATILAVSLQSGTWTGGTAEGRFVIATPTGGSGHFASGASVGGGAATLSGVETAVTMAPGGRVQTDVGNFNGTPMVYGVDGVNRLWQFDGTTLAPITIEGVSQAPTNILVHEDALWVSYGAQVQCSGLSTPFNWSAIAGSVAFRFDSDVTALVRQPGSQSGGAMSVSTDLSTSMIYGATALDFQVVAFEESAGARLYGAQKLGGQTVVFGNIGVYSLSATQNFGNFTPASMTMKIRPFTQTRRNQCTGSLVNKEKSQYRVFFADGYGLYITLLNGRFMGAMPVQFPDPVRCCWQGSSPDGIETSFFGSDGGYVFTLDAGTSFDGQEVTSYLSLPFNEVGSVRTLKRYRRATFEVQSDGYASFDVTWLLNYGVGDRVQGSVPANVVLALSSGFWDDPSRTWDTLNWDGLTLAPSTIELAGTGENIAMRIDTSSALFPTFTINSFILDYSARRAMRGT